jgi:hypothetical protein
MGFWKKYSIIIGVIILLIIYAELVENYPIFGWIGLVFLSVFLFFWLDNAAYGEEIFNLIMLGGLGAGLLFFAYLVYPEGIMDHLFAMLTIEEIGRLFVVVMLLIGFIADVCFMIRYIYKVLR